MAFPHPDPTLIEAEVFTKLPTSLRRSSQRSYWADRNRRGAVVDSFIEGPSFDLEGNLWFVDIPFGRIFRASPNGAVEQITEYEGQPNGLKINAAGHIYIADFRNGIMQLNPNTGKMTTALGDADTEGFKGCNDLHFGPDGSLYFTDQGQTGLQDPSGHAIYVAVTHSNAVWRLPISDSGRVVKAGLFLQFSGGRAGPDDLALTKDGGVVVCQTGMGLVWVHDALGLPIAVVRSPRGLGTTNCAFGGPEGRTLFITESDTGTILRAELPVGGFPMASGWGK